MGQPLRVGLTEAAAQVGGAVGDVCAHLGLVAFDDHEVRPAVVHDLLVHGPLGEGSIYGQCLAVEHQRLEQPTDACQFASVIEHGDLAEDQPSAVTAGAERVTIGRTQSPRGTQRLAIQRDPIHPALGTAAPRGAHLLEPGAEHALDQIDVHVA
jgi:hypothetical protein